MSNPHTTATGWITTETDRIKSWARDRQAVPVAEETEVAQSYTFVHRDQLDTHHSELEWPELASILERHDLVFIHADDDPPIGRLGYFAVTARDRVVYETNIEPDVLERTLRDEHTIPVDLEAAVLEEDRSGQADEIVILGGAPESVDYEAPMAGGVIVRGADSDRRGTDVSPTDRGKPVVDATGARLGTVTGVESGTQLQVDPTTGLGDRLKARLGWGGPPREPFTVDLEHVERITDEHIVLDLEREHLSDNTE